MKKLLASLALVTFLSPITGAMAIIDVGFTGSYKFTDNGGLANFRETLTLQNAFIQTFNPVGDPIFEDAGDLSGSNNIFNPTPSTETLSLATLFLDESSFSSGSFFDFSPNLYMDGFKIFDDSTAGSGLLLKADLTVQQIKIDVTGGLINTIFALNLTNISTFAASPILDAFAAAPGGATNITLQFAGDLSSVIIPNPADPGTMSTLATFSGQAAPVPEPGTMLLMGSGLLGLGLWRKFKK